MKRYLLFGGAILFLIGIIAASIYFQSVSKRPKPLPKNLPQEINDLPVYEWYVCENLGEGSVPGVEGPRLRFRVCHDEGWQILAYCLQPNWPAPEVGAACALINGDTFWCGEGLQNLRQYVLLQTPTPTPTTTPLSTATSTPTPTATVAAATATPGTPLPTGTTTALPGTGTPIAATSTAPATPGAPIAPTPVQRPSPGGSGLVQWLWEKIIALRATPTPFMPQAYTPTSPVAEVQTTPSPEPADSVTTGFYGIDFKNPWERIRIKIYPPDKSVNKGKPIVIAFKPGDTCEYRQHTACINTFTAEAGGEITYVTVHSGVGSEAEAFRQAVEGMGFDQAAYSLRQVKAHLSTLEGARVEIVQGDLTIGDLILASAVRIPGKNMKDYLKAPLPEALQLAGSLGASFSSTLNPSQPQIVFETCGWMMPGEPWYPGVTSTNASLYLGVIQKKP